MSVAVLVIDMAHAGDEDGGRVIDGFASFEAARAYAEARTRASIEELRSRHQSAAALRSLWHLHGEDCLVIGGGFCGRDRLDDYTASPASAVECDWPQLAPSPSSRQKQFNKRSISRRLRHADKPRKSEYVYAGSAGSGGLGGSSGFHASRRGRRRHPQGYRAV